MGLFKNERNNVSNDRVPGASVDIPFTTINPSGPRGTEGATNRFDQNNRIPGGNINGKKDIGNSLQQSSNPDLDIASNTELQFPPEFNVYRNKKTLTEGLLDIALFSANANQLRYILDNRPQHAAIFYITVSLIIISLILQVAIGLLLLLSTRYSVCVECQRQKAYKYGNYALMGFFLITIINIFIAGFGGSAVI